MFSLKINDTLHEFAEPAVMAILNVTPDSFYASSRATDNCAISHKAEGMLRDGADIIDVGAYSTRPGADDVSLEEEMRRLELGIRAIRAVDSSAIISVDTFRADIAKYAVSSLGANIINDISGGTLDSSMIETVARLQVPYVLMHMRGNPKDMQERTATYPEDDVTAGVITELSLQVQAAFLAGISDLIIDPGFGFAKTLQQNYQLLTSLNVIKSTFQLPLLVGLSRKSMIYRLLEATPEEALTGTAVLNSVAFLKGADIVRVHDVVPAKQVIKIVSQLRP